ncbi:MAG: hypothetical protein HY291_20870 [Planctomycetes bacterium]|nr:hypothetical protein [Planctomycetota bacterium]
MFLATARFGANEFQENVVSELGDLHRKERVVLQTGRGVEVGRIEAPPSPMPRGANFPHFAKILRRATPEDLEKQRELEFDLRIKAHQKCAELIEKHTLKMRLVYVELLLGGEKAFFYFISEDRIDFRELVKDLASEFHTRIELRQVGEREAARFLGDYQSCGQKLCCKTFLKKLPPVNMSMARNQLTTLDPGKLAGQCGKLKCCLRYEDSVYTELKKNLPERGTLVITDGAQGEVIGLDVYNQRVTLATADGPRMTVGAGEIREVRPGERLPPRKPQGGEGGDDAGASGRQPPPRPEGPQGSGGPPAAPRGPRGPGGPGRPHGQGGSGRGSSQQGSGHGGSQRRPQGPQPAGGNPALNQLEEPAAAPVALPTFGPESLLVKLLQLRSEPSAAMMAAPQAKASEGASCSSGGCSSGGCGSGGCSSGGCGCSTKAKPRKQPTVEEFYRLRAPAFSRS